MRILANENFPADLVRALREAGHQVAWIWEDARGSEDRAVLARAQSERRVVATFDKDFGELAFRSRLPAQCGILLFRLAAPNPHALVARVLSVIASRPAWEGLFASVTEDRVRVRPLPSGEAP